MRSTCAPATGIVSLVTPDAPSSIRASFCNEIRFFTDADAAKGWLAEYPGARVLPVTDAFEIAQPVVEQILSSRAPSHSC